MREMCVPEIRVHICAHRSRCEDAAPVIPAMSTRTGLGQAGVSFFNAEILSWGMSQES